VVFCYAERLPNGEGFSIHYLPAPDGVGAADSLVAAEALNRGIENCIRRRPDQYQWSYKRFKRRPAGAPSVYRRLS
jgi:KDO2-lipid IV(A) lauroyltransferase